MAVGLNAMLGYITLRNEEEAHCYYLNRSLHII